MQRFSPRLKNPNFCWHIFPANIFLNVSSRPKFVAKILSCIFQKIRRHNKNFRTLKVSDQRGSFLARISVERSSVYETFFELHFVLSQSSRFVREDMFDSSQLVVQV